MNRLHQALAKRSQMYSWWHDEPGHKIIHWAVFILVAVLLTLIVVLALNHKAPPYMSSQADELVYKTVVLREGVPIPFSGGYTFLLTYNASSDNCNPAAAGNTPSKDGSVQIGSKISPCPTIKTVAVTGLTVTLPSGGQRIFSPLRTGDHLQAGSLNIEVTQLTSVQPITATLRVADTANTPPPPSPAPISVKTSAALAFTVNQPVGQISFTASGGTGRYQAWNISGLPSGLVLMPVVPDCSPSFPNACTQYFGTYLLSGTPRQAGTYKLLLKVSDSSGRTGDSSFDITVNPDQQTLTNNAQFINQQVLSTMTPGQTANVSITIKNTGTTTWTKAIGYKLGSQNPQDNSDWGLNRVELSNADNIAPGQTKIFTFSIHASSVPKAYNFQWRMLRENVGWFGDLTQNQVITVGNPPPPPPPNPNGRLNGAFLYTPDVATNRVAAQLDEFKSLGMDIVITSAARDMAPGCGAFSWSSEFPSKLGTILTEAQSRGMKVYVGVDSSGSCAFYNHTSAVVSDLTSVALPALHQYTSYPAFAGWYIPDEPGLYWMQTSYYNYYTQVTSALRQSANKPVIVSPYLGDTYLSPTEMASRSLNFKNTTGVDILAYQDSTGAAGVSLWSGRYTVRDYFTAIAAAIGKQAMWSDNEVFNCCSLTQGGGYRSAAITRIADQIEQSSAVDKKVAWLPQNHMGAVSAGRFPEAPRLLAAYKAFYGISGSYLIPQSYQWTTQPVTQHPDGSNSLLFNKKTGDPKNYNNSEWVGFNGVAEAKIDLGSTKQVQWVAAHLLNYDAAGVKFPDSLNLSCSSDNTNWTVVGTWNLPVQKQDSEYVLSNPQPLNISCRYLKVRLNNTGTTLISELELVN